MRRLEEYVNVGTKRLRCGYTTGTCAAAAARAAAELLFGRAVEAVAVETPAGIPVVIEVEDTAAGDGWAQAAVRKDAGDDPDVTDGILVCARVELSDEPGIRIEGGAGVGRVTQPGLDQPVGAAAINSVPRQMIHEQVEQAHLSPEVRPPVIDAGHTEPPSCHPGRSEGSPRSGSKTRATETAHCEGPSPRAHFSEVRAQPEKIARASAVPANDSQLSRGLTNRFAEIPRCARDDKMGDGHSRFAQDLRSDTMADKTEAYPGTRQGLLVTISVPKGEEIAKKTFNPRLGIEGGISIIGTSGIVRPMSEEALIASIELELNMLAERGARDLLVVPGNYGRDFAEKRLGVSLEGAVQCSNFFGATIDAAVRLGFTRMLIVGHIGKMAKVAGGIMHTHSRMADCRVEVLAAHAALAGAHRDVIARIMAAATTDAALDVLAEAGLVDTAMESLMTRLADKLAHRAGDTLRVEAVVFSNVHGVLGRTPRADDLLAEFRKRQEGRR